MALTAWSDWADCSLQAVCHNVRIMSEILAALPRIFGRRDSDYLQLVRQSTADRMTMRVMADTNRQFKAAYESTLIEIAEIKEKPNDRR